jgi:hypothetical protein
MAAVSDSVLSHKLKNKYIFYMATKLPKEHMTKYFQILLWIVIKFLSPQKFQDDYVSTVKTMGLRGTAAVWSINA